MSRFGCEREESLKRMWQERNVDAFKHYKLSSPNPKPALSAAFDADLVAAVVPPVTVVLEGRSICHRISLHKHSGYPSFARAIHHMFVGQNEHEPQHEHDNNLDLSNAVPGHLIAYEDMENDLLLVGDLNWKDFVRVAKRIRILPAKAKSRKQINKE